jgi:hypothetical protein
MMTPLERSLRRITSSLDEVGQPYALVGGLAVSVRAEPRLTRDADLAVAVDDDAQSEALIRRLTGMGYRAGALIEQDVVGRLATVRLTHTSDGDLVSDLLFASSGIEREIVAAATPTEITPDISLNVAVTGHLIATKLLARDDRSRPTDADDLRALSLVASDADWSDATQAVDLIHERGYDRGRDLQASLIRLREHGAY